jgi:hypothetical protein
VPATGVSDEEKKFYNIDLTKLFWRKFSQDYDPKLFTLIKRSSLQRLGKFTPEKFYEIDSNPSISRILSSPPAHRLSGSGFRASLGGDLSGLGGLLNHGGLHSLDWLLSHSRGHSLDWLLSHSRGHSLGRLLNHGGRYGVGRLLNHGGCLVLGSFSNHAGVAGNTAVLKKNIYFYCFSIPGKQRGRSGANRMKLFTAVI